MTSRISSHSHQILAIESNPISLLSTCLVLKIAAYLNDWRYIVTRPLRKQLVCKNHIVCFAHNCIWFTGASPSSMLYGLKLLPPLSYRLCINSTYAILPRASASRLRRRARQVVVSSKLVW